MHYTWIIRGMHGSLEHIEDNTTTWLVMVTLSPPVAVFGDFRHGNKNTLSLVMVYSARFNKVFKALNLFLYKCVA
jgi:hypothetical protein